jgi:hypothetical protein
MILQGTSYFDLEIEFIYWQGRMSIRIASDVRTLVRTSKATMGISLKQWYFRWMPASLGPAFRTARRLLRSVERHSMTNRNSGGSCPQV